MGIISCYNLSITTRKNSLFKSDKTGKKIGQPIYYPDTSSVLGAKRHLYFYFVILMYSYDFSYKWFIPVTYTSSKGLNNEITWFPDTEDKGKEFKIYVLYIK